MGSTSAAVERMRKVYPEFDLLELEDDAKEIFIRLYEAFLRRDLEYVEKVAQGEALGFFKATITRWEEMQVKPKLDHIWFMENVTLSSRPFLIPRSRYRQFFPCIHVHLPHARNRLFAQYEGRRCRERRGGHSRWTQQHHRQHLHIHPITARRT